MKKHWVILLALISFAVGVGGASWGWMHFYSQTLLGALVANTEADLISKVGVLERLRAGKPDEALRLEEELLDGDLLTAAALAKQGAQFNANARRAVQTEAKARAASGYAPDPRLRAAVQEAFVLVPAATGAAAPRP